MRKCILVPVDFLDVLRRSDLLSAEDIATTVRDEHLEAVQDPKDIAKAFLKSRQLTLFQANHLLHGQPRGLIIDEFKLREILGTGGMGWVYIAEPRDGKGDPRQRFAIKVLSDRIKHDPGIRARFELESRAGLQLNHSNIVRTLKYGQTNDLYGEVPFMVMEYVEGINLQDLMRLRQGPLPWPEAAECIRQAAAGLQHAHENGMVHRDIKPTNLLITKDGHLKILDFGLALLKDDDQAEFSLAMIFGHQCLGTDDYIAPEQSFNSHTVDGRADIYSLGCTFYQILTNAVPFPLLRTPQKIDAHRRSPFPDVRKFVPNLPPQLVVILNKMVAKRPEDRFETAAELAAALAPFARLKPIEFDFSEILKLRALEARKRLQAAHPSSRSNSSSAELKASAPAMQMQPQANIETHVAADTASHGSDAKGGPVSKPAAASHPKLHSLELDLSHLPNAKSPQMFLQPIPGGTSIPLRGTRMIIGRAPESDLRLDSPKVSARHAELRFEGQWWRIRDLNSRKGFRINGVATTDQLLWPGDTILIADQFQFQLQEDPGKEKPRPWLLYGGLALASICVSLGIAYLCGLFGTIR
ncbi:MAG: pknB 10 [Planctomycetaceae bacterium]|nr:pknB 10 [Planctomycetaceae bacterium]